MLSGQSFGYKYMLICECHIVTMSYVTNSIPVLTKAGPIRSMRSVCWDPTEAGIVDDLVHTDVVGNIFPVY